MPFIPASMPGFTARSYLDCATVLGNCSLRAPQVGVAGVAIAKRTSSEQKLCTLWVAPETRNDGLAARLADEAFDWLETTKPLFTVPDVRIKEFARLLNCWDFVETQVVEDMYRRTSREFVFNGLLRPLS